LSVEVEFDLVDRVIFYVEEDSLFLVDNAISKFELVFEFIWEIFESYVFMESISRNKNSGDFIRVHEGLHSYSPLFGSWGFRHEFHIE
jgi:hypothetical protein